MKQIDFTTTIPRKITRHPAHDAEFSIYVFQWSARFAIACGIIGWALVAFAFAILTTRSPANIAVVSFLAGGVCYGCAAAWALTHRADWYEELQHREEVEFTPLPKAPEIQHDPFHTTIKIGKHRLRFWQPAPGALARWLRETLENDSVYFGVKEARRRGWRDDMYREMIDDLRDIGVLANELHNKAPVFTDWGREQIQAWLSG